MLTNLPISILNLNNLNQFMPLGNPIETGNLCPAMIRFLRRLLDNGGIVANIYKDSQNIHTSSIQQSTRKSIIKILSHTF